MIELIDVVGKCRFSPRLFRAVGCRLAVAGVLVANWGAVARHPLWLADDKSFFQYCSSSSVESPALAADDVEHVKVILVSSLAFDSEHQRGQP